MHKTNTYRGQHVCVSSVNLVQLKNHSKNYMKPDTNVMPL